MKNYLLLIVFIAAASSAFGKSKTTIYTENYPPYNYSENGELKGCCTEIVQNILKRLKLDYNIKTTDWNNAYHTTLNNKNAITYSMTQTKGRKPLFKWVGPLLTNNWAFFARKGRPFLLKNLEKARKYKVGTYYNDVCEEFLVEHKFDHIICEQEDYQNIPKLINGAIDLWLTADKKAALLFAKQAGVDPNLIYPVYDVKQSRLCIAFNRQASDTLIKQFQDTLDQMKKDGSYAKIVNKYFSEKSPYSVKVPKISYKKKNNKPHAAKSDVIEKKEEIHKQKIVFANNDKGNKKPFIIQKEYTQITITVPKNQVHSLKKIATQRNVEFEVICSKAFFHYILRNKKNQRKRGRILKKFKQKPTPEPQKKKTEK